MLKIWALASKGTITASLGLEVAIESNGSSDCHNRAHGLLELVILRTWAWAELDCPFDESIRAQLAKQASASLRAHDSSYWARKKRDELGSWLV